MNPLAFFRRNNLNPTNPENLRVANTNLKPSDIVESPQTQVLETSPTWFNHAVNGFKLPAWLKNVTNFSDMRAALTAKQKLGLASMLPSKFYLLAAALGGAMLYAGVTEKLPVYDRLDEYFISVDELDPSNTHELHALLNILNDKKYYDYDYQAFEIRKTVINSLTAFIIHEANLEDPDAMEVLDLIMDLANKDIDSGAYARDRLQDHITEVASDSSNARFKELLNNPQIKGFIIDQILSDKNVGESDFFGSMILHVKDDPEIERAVVRVLLNEFEKGEGIFKVYGEFNKLDILMDLFKKNNLDPKQIIFLGGYN